METNKLSKTANTLGTITRVVEKAFLVCAIVCALCAVLVLLFGQKMFASTTNFTLSLGTLSLALTPEYRPSADSLCLFASLGCLGGAAVLLVCWFAARTLKRILATMAQGRPFAPGTDRQIRHLGWFTLIFGGLSSLLSAALSVVITLRVPVGEMFDPAVVSQGSVNLDFSLDFLWIAALIFLLSYVFRYGQQLQQESDETL